MSGNPEHAQPVALGRTVKAAVFACLSAVLLLGGCATNPSGTIQPLPAASADQGGDAGTLQWHYFRFRFARLADDEVDSSLDLLVAAEIIAPLLQEDQQALPLWRFHRRWPDDQTGHQFSFIVRTDGAGVESINASILAAPLFQRLREEGRLREYRVDVSKAKQPGALAATSDRSWPEDLQREWPYFIMGASRLWLGLVQAEAGKSSAADPYVRYRDAAEAVDNLWFEEANHALFHHLSALFGYQPVRVIRRDIMTF